MLAKGSWKILENLVRKSYDNHTKGEAKNALKNVNNGTAHFFILIDYRGRHRKVIVMYNAT
jgi:signal transduction histidine kinase